MKWELEEEEGRMAVLEGEEGMMAVLEGEEEEIQSRKVEGKLEDEVKWRGGEVEGADDGGWKGLRV